MNNIQKETDAYRDRDSGTSDPSESKVSQVVVISSTKRELRQKYRGENGCRKTSSDFVYMNMSSGCSADKTIFRLDSLADEPYENFISFDYPDSETLDYFSSTVVTDEVVGGAKTVESKRVGNGDSAIFVDHAECKSCSPSLIIQDGVAVEQHDTEESNSRHLHQHFDINRCESETADLSIKNSCVCQNVPIKDKALCVTNGAKGNPSSDQPSKRLNQDQGDFSPWDENKNNCTSVKENNDFNSISEGIIIDVLPSREDAQDKSVNCYIYDPIGSSMASFRSSAVVCHCTQSCRRSSLTDETDTKAAPSTDASVSLITSSTTAVIPSSPIHILSPSSSKSSVSSYFSSAAPEEETFWDAVLLGNSFTLGDSGLDTEESVPSQCPTDFTRSSTDSGWSDGDSWRSRSISLELSTSDSKPVEACVCQVCGCKDRAYLLNLDSGPFSPMWDWTFPTIEDIAPATDPAVLGDPGDYKIDPAESVSLGLSQFGSEESARLAAGLVNSIQSSPGHDLERLTKEGQAGSKLLSLSSTCPLTSLALSHDERTLGNDQPVVTLFNHSVNFWKMEID